MQKVNRLVNFVMERKIIAYRDNFEKFYRSQDIKVQGKIDYVFDLVKFERQIPARFFKYLDNADGIYEVKVVTTFKSIRILCFLDKEDAVVLTNCFLKKSQKTPRKEIILAERLKKEYLIEKFKKS